MDSAMYPPVDRVENWGSKTSRPFFVCEYAHSMGNALGNFKEYMDAFESSPRMVGGAIWDFVDQSLRANPAGKHLQARPFQGSNTGLRRHVRRQAQPGQFLRQRHYSWQPEHHGQDERGEESIPVHGF
ncbi:MAG: glycoside hydrolase family 2 TIM barrel-domain containing protein [Akkermansia sp.]